MSADKPRRLGRGLEALISGATSGGSVPASDLQRIPISRIRPNPFQPRRQFAEADLVELEASLRQSGLLQPITVRRKGDAYELIAGERRLRAATRLGWDEISAIVRDFDDQTMLVLALVENLQRSNLNPIEEARGYRRLIDEFRLTQQQVAESVGKDRTTVTNLLRVLSLPAAVQENVEAGELTLGHARALLPISEVETLVALANSAISQRLSVRELEQLVRERMSPKDASPYAPAEQTQPSKSSRSQRPPDPAVRRLEDDLRRYLQTDVKVQLSGEHKGTIEVAFYSNDDLDRVLDLILRENRKDF
jgi:ParB family chromosome partitioning protein